MRHRTLVLVAATLVSLWTPHLSQAQVEAPVREDSLFVNDDEGRALGLGDVLPRSATLIVFWRVDSRPSREAVIHLHQSLPRLEEKGVVLLGITPSEPAVARAFLGTQGIGFRNLYDPLGRVASAFGLGYVYPSLLLLDGDGKVMGSAEGGGESFDSQLTHLLDLCRPAAGHARRNWILALTVAAAALAALALSR